MVSEMMLDHVPVSKGGLCPPLTIGSKMRSKRRVHSLSAASRIFISEKTGSGLMFDYVPVSVAGPLLCPP